MELFVNKNILEEDYRVEDKFDFSRLVQSYGQIIDRISTNSVIGIVGKFGSGKSVLLYLLSQEFSQYNWIHFDAWKYPERKELWEGFVLDFARQINPNLFVSTKERIDGTKLSATKQLLSTVSQGLDWFVPGVGIIEKFSYFLKSSPAKRVDEIQEILIELIEKISKDICIVVEDIDRSGDKGIFFLETLRNFIKENKLKHKIIIICPIGEKQFNDELDSYGKTLDYVYNFTLEKIDLTNFLKEIFHEKIQEDNLLIPQIEYLFQISIKQFNLTIREIKKILRKVDIEFLKLSESDKEKVSIPIFFLCVIEQYKNGRSQLFFNNSRLMNNFWAYKFILMVVNNKTSEEAVKNFNPIPVFITDKDSYFKPVYINNTVYDDQQGYYLTNFYNLLS